MTKSEALVEVANSIRRHLDQGITDLNTIHSSVLFYIDALVRENNFNEEVKESMVGAFNRMMNALKIMGTFDRAINETKVPIAITDYNSI
ncbi:MAG: hypothetical protein QXP36_09215 [Conexivisphaerales archaeon]